VKSKKILLFILFIIIFITLGTKSFASWYPDAFYDEDKDSYYEIYIGQSIRLSYYGLDRIVSICQSLRTLDKKALSYICCISNTSKEQYRCYHIKQSTPTLWNC